jgi:hypothetical protein
MDMGSNRASLIAERSASLAAEWRNGWITKPSTGISGSFGLEPTSQPVATDKELFASRTKLLGAVIN